MNKVEKTCTCTCINEGRHVQVHVHVHVSTVAYGVTFKIQKFNFDQNKLKLAHDIHVRTSICTCIRKIIKMQNSLLVIFREITGTLGQFLSIYFKIYKNLNLIEISSNFLNNIKTCTCTKQHKDMYMYMHTRIKLKL